MATLRLSVLAGDFGHPATAQFEKLAAATTDRYAFTLADGPELFTALDNTDLLVVAGLFWTGSETVTWTAPRPYTPLTTAQRDGFAAYVASGRPVFAVHGGIASFDDWPDFGRLLGFAWHWGFTFHGPVKDYRVYPVSPDNPLTGDLDPFTITDENYFNVQLVPGAAYETHLKMDCGEVQLPMLVTTEGHVPGAGRSAWLGLGHDHRATDHPAWRLLFDRTVAWLTA